MKEELRLIKQAIGTLQRAVAILEDRLNVDTPEKQNGFRPPTDFEAELFYDDNKFNFSLDTWFDHYRANGWKVGKNPMKDWKASMRKWERDYKLKHPDRVVVRYDASGRPIKANGQERLL